MRKLKIKIEFYSLASFNDKKKPSKLISPTIKTIEPI